MNSLHALEKFSAVCDELDGFMNAENRAFRAGGGADDAALDAKREMLGKLGAGLDALRTAEPTSENPAARQLRDRVQQKILKLLLLSREGEQLLLKGASPRAAAPRSPQAGAARLRNIYQPHRAG